MNQYLKSFFSLYLLAANFPDMGYPYPGFPYLDKPYPARPHTAGSCPGNGRLVDDILYIHNFALAIPQAIVDYVSVSLNYKEGTTTITFNDLKAALINKKTGSDLDCSTAERK